MKQRTKKPRRWVRWGLWTAFTLTVVIWIGSGWVWAWWWHPTGALDITEGTLIFARGRNGLVESRYGLNWVPKHFNWRTTWWAGSDALGFQLPLWFPALLLALAAGAVEFRHRRRVRDPGVCVCGYPVAGLDRCPECGTEKASGIGH